jgi:hypothetical protein
MAACSPVSRLYVEADRATFDAVAPEYLGYVQADPMLGSDQRNDRLETIRSWEARLDQANESAE